MYRFIAFLISLGTGGAAGWYVYINLDLILDSWLTVLGFAAGVLLVVTCALYFPLLRHIADLVEEQFSTVYVRFTARKTGLGFDEIPQSNGSRHREHTQSNRNRCSICGGPGGPVCDSCHARMGKQ